MLLLPQFLDRLPTYNLRAVGPEGTLYVSGAGIALPLENYFPGSPHKLANATQAALKNAKIPGMYVAYEALWAAGCDAASIEKIMKVVENEMNAKDIKLPWE